jgi:hypothetical protein
MSRNTYIVIGLALVACIVLFFGGCSATSISPFSGKEVTAEQLSAEVKVEELKVKREADAIKSESERKLADTNAAQKKAKAAFDRAVAKVQSEASAQVAVLASELEQAQIDTERVAAGIIAETTAKIADLDARREASAESARIALADIEAKQAKYETFLSVGQTLAAGLGPYGGLASGLLGLGGILFGVSKRRDAQAAHESAGRIIDAIDVLKTKRPEVAEAFQSESKLISEWMGSDAVKLVNKVQNS